MSVTRREFIRTGVAAGALGATGLASAKTREEIASEVKFIDIHSHVSEYPLPPIGGRQPLCCADQLLAHWDRLGVEKGVVLGLGQPETNVGGMSTESLLRLAKAHPDRFVPACGVDPRAIGNSAQTKFADIMKYYRDKGCRAVGEVCANLHFLDPRVQNFFRGVEAAGLPLTFHVAANEEWMYGLVDEKGLPELEESLRRFPGLKFLGHSQSFWCEIGTYRTWDERTGYPKGPVREGRIAQLMRKYPNLYGDLSAGSGCNALSRDPDYAAKFLTEFQDRLFFGLDICRPDGYVSPLGDFLRGLFLGGRIDEAVFRKVARGNAETLLGLA